MAAQKGGPGKDSGEERSSRLLEEMEKVGETVIGEIRRCCDLVGSKASSTAKGMAGTEAGKRVVGVLEEVQRAGEGLIHLVGEQIDTLKGRVMGTGKTGPAAKKKAAKKKTAKKAAPSRKKAARKKAAPAKAAKKAPGPTKKGTGKKKAAARKKAAAGKKKATAAKTARKS